MEKEACLLYAIDSFSSSGWNWHLGSLSYFCQERTNAGLDEQDALDSTEARIIHL